MIGERTASITGLVLTRNVAFATVVSFTAKMKVAKCRLSNSPDAITSSSSDLRSAFSSRLERAKMSMSTAAIDSRKNVSEIALACVANLMKIALEPKNIEAMNRTAKPVG